MAIEGPFADKRQKLLDVSALLAEAVIGGDGDLQTRDEALKTCTDLTDREFFDGMKGRSSLASFYYSIGRLHQSLDTLAFRASELPRVAESRAVLGDLLTTIKFFANYLVRQDSNDDPAPIPPPALRILPEPEIPVLALASELFPSDDSYIKTEGHSN